MQDNPSELRYELLLDDDVIGEILYRLVPDAVVLVHTEISPSLEGKGFGARLVAGALDDIRARGAGLTGTPSRNEGVKTRGWHCVAAARGRTSRSATAAIAGSASQPPAKPR